MIFLFLCWLQAGAQPLSKWDTQLGENAQLDTWARSGSGVVGAGDATIVQTTRAFLDDISEGSIQKDDPELAEQGFYYANEGGVEGVFYGTKPQTPNLQLYYDLTQASDKPAPTSVDPNDMDSKTGNELIVLILDKVLPHIQSVQVEGHILHIDDFFYEARKLAIQLFQLPFFYKNLRTFAKLLMTEDLTLDGAMTALREDQPTGNWQEAHNAILEAEEQILRNELQYRNHTPLDIIEEEDSYPARTEEQEEDEQPMILDDDTYFGDSNNDETGNPVTE